MLFLFLVPLLLPAQAQDQDRPQTREVIIENVDHLEQVIEDGEIVRRLTGNVRLKQDSTFLQSDRALQYIERDEIFFFGDVLIVEQGDSLRADTVFYNRRSKVGEATGRVEFFDGEVRVLAPSGTHYADEKRTEFTDGVMLVDSLTTLTSWEGEYLSEEKRAEFARDIRLHRPWSYLEADSITYYRETDISIARGDVFIERWEEAEEGVPPDSVSRTFLLGDWAYNDEPVGLSRMEGRSLVMQLRFDEDSAEIDTLVMRSDRLEALELDERRRIIAIGNVRSWRKDFAAIADSVVYDRYEQHIGPIQEEAPPLLLADAGSSTARTVSPSAASPSFTESDTTRIDIPSPYLEPPAGQEEGNEPLAPSDSLQQRDELSLDDDDVPAFPAPQSWLHERLKEMLAEQHARSGVSYEPAAEDDTVEEVRLFRNPIAWFEKSQVSADSIRVRTDSTPIDSLFARGQVFIAQIDTLTERINQLRGRNMAGTSIDDSLRTFAVGPNAEAIYHRKNEADEPDGAVQALGDESLFRFIGDDPESIQFTGGIEGYYYDEEDMPSSLQLDGYIWVPERRSQKDKLLAEDPEQHDRIVRVLATYPPLPDRVPDAPPMPGSQLGPRPDTVPIPESSEEEETLTAPEGTLPQP